MDDKITTISPPSPAERKSLRLMIFIGILSVVFFLYSMLQKNNISYFPLYVLLMITLVYYSCKYLHEWYHYFSISTSAKPLGSKIYSVDILTTYCAGEPFDMLEQTLIAIQNISYPHIAWCCDEADDPMVKQLCESLGVKHVTRIIKKDAKAGNINNALQFATGEICLVLDPDHIPVPEFLDVILPYFDDPSIGFVQIVQAYYNQTETMVAKGAAQQTYQFYGPVMMTMNSYGTVQAIGANCTFRRAALDSIGGHASGLAEDMHTAMQMHAKGWRSVYVPAILTRGLVPATMSSYYKQQLKWSRGTWELFVTAFPKLYTKFTWRQKLHYFTLPFHYLSGLIFLINFLIPVISLSTGYIPLQMDVFNFLLAAFPLFCMGIFIRHYVQKWVAEEPERGFHIVGGILQIGAWWIHSVGFIYTLIRKKVPYIPTPKNDSDSLPLLLSLPNILVALISLAAIVYGFWYDYTPYTVFMAMLAFMQIVFMGFIFSISGYVRDNSKLNRIATRLKAKNGFIILAHGFLRKYSVPLSIAVIIVFVFGFMEKQRLPDYLPKPLPGLQVFYNGLYLNGNLGTDKMINQDFSAAVNKNNIDIVALNIPWGKDEKNILDTVTLNKLYDNNSLPLLVWKPWQNDSAGHSFRDSAVMRHIVSGKYDKLILSFATQVAQLNKFVFVRYSNQPVDDKYPLFAPAACRPEDFIAAWQYVHHVFEKAGADKVIWVWNPWDPASVNQFFPGNNYVDWLGINIGGSDAVSFRNNTLGFDSAYRPYHRLPLFTSSGLPVMITETAGYVANSVTWWNAAWKTIDTGFTEIKSVIGGAGDNVFTKPVNTVATNTHPSVKMLQIKDTDLPKYSAGSKQYSIPHGIKNIIYNKGYRWFRNRHTLNLKTIEEDVAGMKAIGINTIERIMPGFYDDKLEKILLANKMNLVPRFWLLAAPEVIADDRQMEEQKEKILKVIKNNLSRENIIAWNLGDDVLYVLGNQTYKPGYFYYRQKYIAWLAGVCTAIRQLDSSRPIIMDLHWDAGGLKRFQYYKIYVPWINSFMLEADTKYRPGLAQPLEAGMAWGKVPVELWQLLPSIRQSGTVPAWQDIENTSFISMDGILDIDGRKKEQYATVMNTWGNKPAPPSAIPEIKILRPLAVTKENTRLHYQVIYKKDNARWLPFSQDMAGIRFEWYLVRIDQYGNTMFIKKAGEGTSVKLFMPKDPNYYQLYVEAITGGEVKMVHASLNTPLE